MAIPAPTTLWSKFQTESGVQLRSYQEECIASIEEYIRGGDNRLLIQLPTGTGKTVTFSEFARRRGGRVLILVHRDELVRQTKTTLQAVYGDDFDDIGIVQAERQETGRLITIASVASLSRPARFEKTYYTPQGKLINIPDLVITDEAHHSLASTYQDIYREFGLLGGPNPKAPIHLGPTATPGRTDKWGLHPIFDKIAYRMSIKDAVKSGYLCNIKAVKVVFENEDLETIKTSNGDYSENSLEKAINKVARNEEILKHWLEQTGGAAQTIAFCASVNHSEELAELFRSNHIKAASITGDMDIDVRRNLIKSYMAGDIRVLTNFGVLTEGTDLPATSCIIMARPTKSRLLFTQAVGRGLRLYPDKPFCLVLEVTDVHAGHRLTDAVSLADAVGATLKPGQTLKEALAETEERDGQGRVYYETGKTKGVNQFDPFEDPFSESNQTRYKWLQSNGGNLALLIPTKGRDESMRCILISRRDDGLYDVLENIRTRIEGTYEPDDAQVFLNKHPLPDATLAASFAEKYVQKKQLDSGFMNKDAAWLKRDEPPSPAQLKYLRSLYFGYKGPRPIPNTKAEASALINARLAATVDVKIKRPDEF